MVHRPGLQASAQSPLLRSRSQQDIEAAGYLTSEGMRNIKVFCRVLCISGPPPPTFLQAISASRTLASELMAATVVDLQQRKRERERREEKERKTGREEERKRKREREEERKREREEERKREREREEERKREKEKEKEKEKNRKREREKDRKREREKERKTKNKEKDRKTQN